MAKDAKDVTEDNALDYVAGYTVGNDISARKWQRDPAYAGGVPQWCFSKGFDGFAPLGPCIVSTAVVGDASDLQLRTMVNGEIRQDTSTSDLLFGVKKLVSFLSSGTTLKKGSLIMTGTPAGMFMAEPSRAMLTNVLLGVAMGMKDPKWLQNGDEVEVFIASIGTLKHGIRF